MGIVPARCCSRRTEPERLDKITGPEPIKVAFRRTGPGPIKIALRRTGPEPIKNVPRRTGPEPIKDVLRRTEPGLSKKGMKSLPDPPSHRRWNS